MATRIPAGKVALALGNISGAMMIQATVPTALGLLFTPWMLEPALLWGAVVTLLGVFGINGLLRRRTLTPHKLAAFGWLYVIFLQRACLSCCVSTGSCDRNGSTASCQRVS